MKVHTALGRFAGIGLRGMSVLVNKTGLNVGKQTPLPLVYEDVKLECGYRWT